VKDPQKVADATATRIEETEASGLNGSVAFDRQVVMRQAVDVARAKNTGPLAATTVAVKDNICTLEYPTTCASRILAGYQSPYEATAVSRLKAAGALMVCKANLDEFAMGSSTEHSAFGRTRHPTHPERVPGGSSGGSAALVATEAVDVALGSETGGSVRQPAAFCGVVGLKPSYGRVSRFGLVAFGSSLDQIGVLSRTVRDAASVFAVISGSDPNDATCVDDLPVDAHLERRDLSGVVVGVPEEYFPKSLNPSIRTACDRCVAAMRDDGAQVRRVSLPHTHRAVPCYYIIAPAEASSNLARYDGVRFGFRGGDPQGDVAALYHETRGTGFGPEVRRRIIIGTYVLSSGYYEAYYRRALVTRGLIARDFQHVFDDGIDLLFTPTTPTTAFKAGERLDDPVAMYLQDVFVCSANLAGLPALSLPIGRAEALPIGGQLIAPAFREELLLDVADVLESLLESTEEVR
jgi:aspartyl-tRNA(Asn)/glutamyl-tRNA(Gln) amidotransferase subunit A